MAEFHPKSVCVLGRQPEFGIAELESLYGPEHVKSLSGVALLDIDAGDINFKRLGGTIKVARILSFLPSNHWSFLKKYLIENVPHHLEKMPPGKFRLGVSAYGIKISPAELNRTNLAIKKAAKRSLRVIPNKALALNSAQVLHNKLTSRGAWELLLIVDGKHCILAQTFFIQDIEAYSARDQARPKRDAKVGMLPPKLAQIMINLAAGPFERQLAKDKKTQKIRMRLLDPFCGSGVVLQEALLMGYSVIGSDIDPRMVEYAETNIQWLVRHSPGADGSVAIEVGDARSSHWPRFSFLASELSLGDPLSTQPSDEKVESLASRSAELINEFLANLGEQLISDRQKICLALPAWRLKKGGFTDPTSLVKISALGYNELKFQGLPTDKLIYWREGQFVGRRLIVLEKANK